MPEISEKISFTIEHELGEDGAVPDEVQVLPSGDVNPRGKTSFVVDEESRALILERYGESGTDLVVDYEHQTLSGSEAPAAGWVKQLIDKGEDGVWAKVKWTERAAGYLRNREYRYLSPVVLIRKKDSRAVELLGAALTNLPAIEGMVPVVNKDTTRDTASPEDFAYREKYCKVLELLGLGEDAAAEELAERVESLKNPAGFVPAGEHEKLKEKYKAGQVELMVTEALKNGRITPSLVPWAREYAGKDPDGFTEFVNKGCPVISFGNSSGGGRSNDGPRVDRRQSEVNRLLGISDETFARLGDDEPQA